MSKLVIILCSPRSGSTLMARILLELGVDMGSGLHRKKYLNPMGTFEDREFEKLIRGILVKSGFSYNWLTPIPQDDIKKSLPEFEEKLKS